MTDKELLNDISAKAMFKLPKPTAFEHQRTVPPYSFESVKMKCLEKGRFVERYCWVLLTPSGERNMGILWMESCYLQEGLHTADTFAAMLERSDEP